MTWFFILLAILFAYLIGSLSSAILVCKVMQLPDPRTQGSGNPGATNVLRIGGKLPAILTLLGDILKGFLPVMLARTLTDNSLIVGGIFLATILGHVYPLFFRFQGGKGVATLIGAMAALSPLLCGIYLLTWVSVFGISKISSLSALIATVTMPIWAWFLLDRTLFMILLALAIFIIWRHRSNIRQLLQGQEDKSSFK